MNIDTNTYVVQMPAGRNLLLAGSPAYAKWLAWLIRQECRACQCFELWVVDTEIERPTCFSIYAHPQ